jgi:hypothetical protein
MPYLDMQSKPLGITQTGDVDTRVTLTPEGQ